MIEINLLPGSGKKSRRGGVSSGISTALAGVVGQIKDPYMIGAGVTAVLVVAAVAVLHLGQANEATSLATREASALADSARFATVILEKRRAEAKRDSVLRQVKLIETIDSDRYVWPHLLAEVSKSVPPFTWIGEIKFVNSVPSPAAPVAIDSAALRAATTHADSLRIMTPRSDPLASKPSVRFTLKGYTVDVQAMTRLIRDMEASPFIENVQLTKSTAVDQFGSAVTEFNLDAQYQIADTLFIKRSAIAGTQR
jgi:Tfp pilus assembly protein PilN